MNNTTNNKYRKKKKSFSYKNRHKSHYNSIIWFRFILHSRFSHLLFHSIRDGYWHISPISFQMFCCVFFLLPFCIVSAKAQQSNESYMNTNNIQFLIVVLLLCSCRTCMDDIHLTLCHNEPNHTTSCIPIVCPFL